MTSRRKLSKDLENKGEEGDRNPFRGKPGYTWGCSHRIWHSNEDEQVGTFPGPGGWKREIIIPDLSN